MTEHIEISDLQQKEVESNEQNDSSDTLVNEVLDDAINSQISKDGADSTGKQAGNLHDNLPDFFGKSEQSDDSRVIENVMKGGISDGAVFGKILGRHDFKPSDKEITKAVEKAEKEISKLIPKEDREKILGMTTALLKGDVKGLQEVAKSLKDNPEKLAKYVEEVEKILNDASDGSINAHLAVNKDGNLIVYSEGKSAAVEITPDGKAGVRPVSVKDDGTVVLEPGEVLNKKADEVMKQIGNESVHDMIYGDIFKANVWKEDVFPRPMPEPPPHDFPLPYPPNQKQFPPEGDGPLPWKEIQPDNIPNWKNEPAEGGFDQGRLNQLFEQRRRGGHAGDGQHRRYVPEKKR